MTSFKTRDPRDTGSVPPELVAAMLAAVDQWVGYYARRVPWIDAEDMRGEAIEDCVAGCRSYDASKGEPGPYFARAARRAIFNYLIRAQSPVSGSVRSAKKELIAATAGKRSFEGMLAAGSASGRLAAKNQAAIERGAQANGNWTQAVLDDERRRVAILARVLRVVGPEGRPYVIAKLLGDPPPETPDEVRAMNRARRRAKHAILADDRLRDLLRRDG